MKNFLKLFKCNFNNFVHKEGISNKNNIDNLFKMRKTHHSNFHKSNFFNFSQKTKSKNNNYFNSNTKPNKENKHNNSNQSKQSFNKQNKADSKNTSKDNINTCESKIENNKISKTNKKKETNTEKFLNYFKENFPLELYKKKSISIDNNLTCFVPYDQIINRIKAVSIGKTYLGNLVDSEADFSGICEDNFFKLITSKLDNIKDFKIEDDDIIKFNLSFNKSLKKVKFLVNLHDIKNYMCIGYDPSKEIAKNLKNYQHLEDHIIENPFNQFKDLNNPNKLKSPNQARTRRTINIESENENNTNNESFVDKTDNPDLINNQEVIETIKCDLIINREFNGVGGFSQFCSAEDLKRKYQEFKISLISHFYFSLIIEKIKDSDDSLKLVLSVRDELDDISTKKEFEIEQIDFICQAEILKINYHEYQESIRLMEIMEKTEKMKNSNELSIDSETKEKINNLANINDSDSDEKIEMLNHNQITDILKNLNYLKNMAKTEKLKIVNVDGIYKYFNII